MATLRVDADDFTLRATWTCTVRYTYNSSGSFLSSTITGKSNMNNEPENTVQFTTSLPSGAKVLSAKVHASYTTGLLGGDFTINDIAPDDDGFVALDTTDFSAGYVDVKFTWKANTCGSSAHKTDYPTYNGSSSQSVTKNHSSPSNVTDVYLLIEYSSGPSGSYIYHVEDGVLVPYYLYHAENGTLVQYSIYHVENNELVQY